MSTPPPAPSRNDRKACWAARDEFFQCLNANSVNVPPEFQPRGQGACAKQREAYEGACAKSWVEYFNKRRVLEIRQQITLDAQQADRDARDRAYDAKQK
ncbi:hypothetical protein FFLO_03211 [Filobasidium floriforme]|uniref:Cytochrome c oxidase assembly factor 6 n=1 Tax=Filobasidium floriforme TaxID=5210 RepID=A0A8K0JL59_9TREE|nr:hypothetical protein FFLO_03211 [Filobasidium floriforme]